MLTVSRWGGRRQRLTVLAPGDVREGCRYSVANVRKVSTRVDVFSINLAAEASLARGRLLSQLT